MFNKSCLIKKYMLYGVIAIVLISSLSHFLYGFSGNIKIVGIFTPINESIWEHLKLAFYPTVLWWGMGYFIYRRKMYIDIRKWIMSMTISIIISPIIIIIFFYTYTGALGIQNLVLDIFSLILGVFIGQLIGLKYYENYKYNKVVFYSLMFILLLDIVLFTYFTFNPPNIPLFIDSTTGLRGIYLY